MVKQSPADVLQNKCSKNFANFTGKPLCWSLFLKSCRVEAWNIIKKRLQHKCFPVNILKFLKTPILKNICERLLLYILK